MLTAESTRTSFCAGCGRVLPIDQFRRRRKNSEQRHSQCTECHYRYRRGRTLAKQRQGVTKFAKGVAEAKRDRNKVVHLTGLLFRHFGDYEGLARHWKAAYDESHAAGRHLTAAKLLCAVVDLGIVSEQLQREDMRNASDQEITESVEHGLERIVRHRPELVLAAAKQCGWTVIPPSQEDNHDRDTEG